MLNNFEGLQVSRSTVFKIVWCLFPNVSSF